MIIAIDFDGTCVTHTFPGIGEDIGAVPVLKRLVNEGHKLILFTMRSNRFRNQPTGDPDIADVTGDFLTDAIRWFRKHDIPLWSIQVNPDQHTWTLSPKPYAHLYINDAALGCPLKVDKSISNKPFVDWVKVEQMLIELAVLSNQIEMSL